MKRTTVNPALTPNPSLVTLSTQAPERPQMGFLEVTHLETSGDQGKREISGLALPYGEEMERLHLWTGATRQVFDKGSAEVAPDAKVYYGHDHLDRGMPVGKITGSEQTDQGLRITASLSATAKGEEVYTLLKDGVLDRFSVGFLEQTYTLEQADGPEPLVRHTSVLVKETSVVPDPQYDSAKIDSVLHQQHPNHTKEGTNMTEAQRRRLAALRAMTTLSGAESTEMANLAILEARQTDAGDQENLATAEEVTALSASVDTLARQVATLGDAGGLQTAGGVPPEFQAFESYGHWLQALASGKSDEALQVLAYVGGVVGDLGDWVKDSWVGDLYRPLQERRRVLNLFTQRPLPATGMGVEFGRLLSDTTAVEEQLNEGDLLAYGKIAFETDRAGLKTYGGWGDMSRQEIERSSMAVVEKFFQALLRRYAQTTEAAVRSFALDPANAVELTTPVPDLATADGWTDLVIDASFLLDDNGLAPEFSLVSRDVFKDLAHIQVGPNGAYFLDRNTGRMDITGLSGEVFNVQVVPVAAPAGTVRVCDSSAVAVFEASGAPFRLQDDDITHLTKAFSTYGYMALADEDHNAIVRPNDGV